MNRRGRDNPRLIFPLETWFNVPYAIYRPGFADRMTGAMFKRYATIRYLANLKKKNEFQFTLEELERLDGISPRQAHEVNALLSEMRMISVDRRTKPYTYVVYASTEWQSIMPVRSRTKQRHETCLSGPVPVPW